MSRGKKISKKKIKRKAVTIKLGMKIDLVYITWIFITKIGVIASMNK